MITSSTDIKSLLKYLKVGLYLQNMRTSCFISKANVILELPYMYGYTPLTFSN